MSETCFSDRKIVFILFSVMLQVIIASENPVKMQAVQNAFTKVFPQEEFSFVWISVPSGVADQPMTNDETFLGAQNRAYNAKIKLPDADYRVGIEGGIEKKWSEMEVFAWIVISSAKQIGKGRSSTFFLPSKIVKLIDQWIELGKADDIVFGRENSKHGNGAVGILTGDLITRTAYYVEPIILALIPFRNKELY